MSQTRKSGLRRWWRTSGWEAGTRLLGWFLGTGLQRPVGGPEALPGPASQPPVAPSPDPALQRLVGILGDLRGPFVKIGQLASLRVDVLPPDAREALASLQDQVPPLPFEEIREILEDELGGPLAEHFRLFEARAVGAASIGQVHRAELLNGDEVAVKIQYPWIAASAQSDLRIVRWALRIYSVLKRKSIPHQEQLFEEFSAGLQEELDFTHEASCAEQISQNLSGEKNIVVPKVFPDHCTHRVLTSSYYKTISIERTTLEENGVEVQPVLEALARAYAKMVFVDGLFHADPHPGNLYVIDEPGMKTQPRVLFVDFGLSKRLDPQLRDAMRKGLYALLQRDVEGFVFHMDEMGMIEEGARDGVQQAISTMFETISQAAQGENGPPQALGIAGSQVLGLKDRAKILLEQTPGLQLPNDLLLYAKTLSYLFALGERLAPDVDLLRLSLPYVLRFLAESPGSKPEPSISDRGAAPEGE